MEKKDTSKMIEELKLCPDFTEFYDNNKDYMASQDLSSMLSELLNKKNITLSDAVKKSELSNTYAYQIFSGVRVPGRKKLLCIAFGMSLSLEETQALLKCAGYPALYVKLPFDCVVIYGICKGLTIVQTNSLLFEKGLETLG